MVMGGNTNEHHAKARHAGKVEWPKGVLGGKPARFLNGLHLFQMAEVDERQRERIGGLNVLENSILANSKNGPQRFVARDDLRKSFAEGIQIERATNSEGKRIIVDGAIGPQRFLHPVLLLEEPVR